MTKTECSDLQVIFNLSSVKNIMNIMKHLMFKLVNSMFPVAWIDACNMQSEKNFCGIGVATFTASVFTYINDNI